ncbi:hypothetical protein S23_21070 [Bradyrhizobium cosmicum]|uniref:Uncharacterized protein n=1 Tax=Bradyrhizobium cosmicum TaxID=1404864 RepID=A0AAI8MB50_9BRAD|nr:hypothetical protein S23_21070 [Bradyrhizobium cosmicum]
MSISSKSKTASFGGSASAAEPVNSKAVKHISARMIVIPGMARVRTKCGVAWPDKSVMLQQKQFSTGGQAGERTEEA